MKRNNNRKKQQQRTSLICFLSSSAIVVICFLSIGIIIGENNVDRYNANLNNLLRGNEDNNNGGGSNGGGNGGGNGSAAVDAAAVGEMTKETNTNMNTNTRTWDNWPAVAHEETGHSLVTKGDSFFHHARDHYFQNNPNTGQTLMDEFVKIYKNRPDQVNLCGIRINHALALFLAVKQIQPSLVIESGVNAGQSTYFIRAASPTTKIFAIDPLENPICGQLERWMDTDTTPGKTTYYTGANFIDLMDIDYKGMIARKEIDPDKTLVFIDDHLHTFKRIAGVMKVGFRHIVVEDNYKLKEGKLCVKNT